MLSKRKKQNTVKTFQEHDTDTGSAAVQVALLTKKISALADHLKKNNKDHHSRRGLLMMVGKRRRFLQYIERTDEKKYKSLLKKIKIDGE